jgi:hypothetical protein
MGFHFRKSLWVVPGVRINVSSKGFSTTIGVRGASINIGPNGTYLNAGIPGSGIGYRGRLDNPPARHVHRSHVPGPAQGLPSERFLIPGTRVDFGGGDVGEMTSVGLNSFKDLVLETRQRKADIEQEIRSAKRQLFWARVKLVLAHMPPIWPFTHWHMPRLRLAVGGYRDDVGNLEKNLGNTVVKVDFDLETEVAAPFKRLDAVFDEMVQAQRHWSVRTQQQIDRVAARSWAGTVVDRKAVKIFRGGDPLIETTSAPMAFGTANGRATAYFYPGFVLISGRDDFALIDMVDLQVRGSVTSFVEHDAVPSDAETIGSTWVKANKDGSRDRRFSQNRQVPIMRYGELRFTTEAGLNELYHVSRWRPCDAFARAIDNLRQVVKTGGVRVPKPKSLR